MAIAISSITTNTEDGTGATISCTSSESPTTTVVGDLVVVIHGNDYYDLANMPTPTATGSPTLTSIVNADAGSLTAHIKSWYYIANTGGAQTVSVTETGAAGEEKFLAVYVLHGADTSGSPIDGTPASNVNASAVLSQDCPAVTVSATDSYLILAVQSGGGAAASAYAPPGTVTEKYDIRVATFGSAAGGIKQLSASGSTGTQTWTATGATPYAAVSFAIKTAAAGAAAVPYNPQRSVLVRDYGESYWTQKDRRNANLVATAANDLDVPLLLADTQRQGYATSVRIDRREVPQQPNRVGDMSLFASTANDLAQPLFQPVDGRYWHLYNDVALRTWRPQQRTYFDQGPLAAAVAMDPPAAQRYVPPRDYGEVQWHQLPGRDPNLLTTAQLENELLGGGDTARHYTWAASRRVVPQQRQYFDVSLLATALLEGPLVWIRPPQYVVDRREVPQQRAYMSDPSMLVPAVADAFYVPPRQLNPRPGWMPQQRQLESPPGLLDTALLESPLLVGSFRQTFTERRVYPRQFVWLGQIPEIADPLLVGNGVGGDRWRRYNTPATNVDRRLVPQQPLRQTFFYTADLGLGPNVPFTDTTPAGTFVSESGTGQTQQTVGVAIVSEGGIVIVSQTLGGVL